MRVLALITDAFGGYGGIALYNRDVLRSLCEHSEISEVVAVPRVISNSLEPLPHKLDYVVAASRGIIFYVMALFKVIIQYKRFDFILCGHINLMPVAWLLGKIMGAPVVLEIYGIEAWQPTRRVLTDRLVSSADVVISISHYTKERFLSWACLDDEKCNILPNAIHLEKYGVGEDKGDLRDKYGLEGKKVILTLGRLVSQERAKGFDEILEVLPSLAHIMPDVVYVIAGDGIYKSTLEDKAVSLGVASRVVFTGMVSESEKASLYRSADLYAMPSRGEGFGFVFLEAMACGTPVLASTVDGSRDAVRDGELGIMVDPDNSEELLSGLIQGLNVEKGIPSGLKYFSFPNFSKRLHIIIDTVLKEKL